MKSLHSPHLPLAPLHALYPGGGADDTRWGEEPGRPHAGAVAWWLFDTLAVVAGHDPTADEWMEARVGAYGELVEGLRAPEVEAIRSAYRLGGPQASAALLVALRPEAPYVVPPVDAGAEAEEVEGG